jgi:ribosome-associated protein
MAVEGLELAKACAKAADEIQAEKIRVWDLRGLSNLTDFMVVCSGSSMPHLRAILRDVRGHVDDWHGAKPAHAEGNADTKWVVLDYIDVMVHVMHEELRDYYGLEELWADAKEIDWKA